MTGTDPTLVDALLAGRACGPVARDRIRCSGPDTVRFLHSLLSQSVEDLAVGDARWSFLLEPQGRLVALARVERTGDDEVVLDTDPGVGAVLRMALLRYRIRTRCDLAEVEALEVLAHPGPRGVLEVVAGAGLPLAGADEVETARVIGGIARHGSELGPETIPNGTGLVPIATARKGCYVGQELVERIDSRGGNVPERLVLLDGQLVVADDRPSVDGPVGIAGPLELHDRDGAVVGRLTSAAVHRGTLHAIGWARRAVPAGAELVGTGDGLSVRLVVRRDAGPV